MRRRGRTGNPRQGMWDRWAVHIPLLGEPGWLEVTGCSWPRRGGGGRPRSTRRVSTRAAAIRATPASWWEPAAVPPKPASTRCGVGMESPVDGVGVGVRVGVRWGWRGRRAVVGRVGGCGGSGSRSGWRGRRGPSPGRRAGPGAGEARGSRSGWPGPRARPGRVGRLGRLRVATWLVSWLPHVGRLGRRVDGGGGQDRRGQGEPKGDEQGAATDPGNGSGGRWTERSWRPPCATGCRG